MPDLAHIAISLATNPLAGLLLAFALSIVLIVPAQKLWWIHAPLVLFLLILSLAFHDKRHLSFDSYLSGSSPSPRFLGTFPISHCSIASAFPGLRASP